MKFKIGGYFVIEHWRKGILLGTERIKNGVTIEGLNDLLGVGFRAQSQHSNWYFGLISGAAAPTLLESDTMASHAGWSEITDYTESARLAWVPVQSADKVIVNTAYPAFTINATVSVAGAFIASSSTKGGSTGVLWSTGLFANGTAAKESGDVLKTYYELTAAGS